MNVPKMMDTTGMALVFDELGFTGHLSSAAGEPRQTVQSTIRHAPPSMIVPRLPGEPLRLDCVIPLHPRGTGCPWPPEARVDASSGAGRFPLAAAWAGLPTGQKWTWRPENHVVEVDCARAIAVAFSDVVRLHPSLHSDGVPTLVIPNTTRQMEQQTLLDEARQAGLTLQLLWRPIAAAMVWCEENREFLHELDNQSNRNPGGVIGRVVCLHLGLAAAEAAVLDVVREEHEGQVCYIPARRRPDVKRDSLASLGWTLLRSHAVHDLADAGLPSDDAHLWQILFATNWASIRLAEFGGEQPPSATAIQLPNGLRVRATRTAATDRVVFRHGTLELPGGCVFAQNDPNTLQTWLNNCTQASGGRVIGAVATGEIASVQFGNAQSLSQAMLRCVGLPKERILIGGAIRGRFILARGAALFSARLKAGIPTYLDTLPRLQLLIRRGGEMVWEDLLEETHAYVPGGRDWIRPEPVSDLAIPRGEPNLVFAVYHEEHLGVRVLTVPLPRPCGNEEPARLRVSITPAQGNARLEVQPNRSNLFGTSRVLVDWKRMRPEIDNSGRPVDRDAYVQRQPRIYPELLPRLHSAAKWRAVFRDIEAFLVSNQTMRDTHLVRIIERLKQKDPSAYPRDATAVSCEGRVSHHQNALDRFIGELVQQHRRTAGQRRTRIIRCLGYTSTDDAEFSDWLADELSRGDSGDVLLACGQCFRKPSHVTILADRFSRVFARQRIGNRLNWLKALAAILCYRSEATKDITSDQCSRITEVCLRQVVNELEQRNANYIFRYAALVIVFMLRRRMFDNGFLAPDSELAVHIKNTFRETIQMHRSGRLTVLGGAVDLPRALQQMIDYIDRRGMGSILLGMVDD